jgi:beta-galactosidase
MEYKKAIEPVQLVEGTETEVTIINRYDFISLDHLKCTYSIVGDGFTQDGDEIIIPSTAAGKATKLAIPKLSLPETKAETLLQLVFTLKEATLWAEAGHEITTIQVPIQGPIPVAASSSSTSSTSVTEVSQGVLEIKSDSSRWSFDCVLGALTSWTKGDVEILHTGPQLDFYRALTDNDEGRVGREWKAKNLHLMKSFTRSVTWTTKDGVVVIVCKQRIAPPVLEWSVDAEFTYTFNNTGLSIAVSGVLQGQNLPASFPRIGLTLSLNRTFENVAWFGRGPGESYKDKKLSQKVGTYSMLVEKLMTDYEFPQENGNRTDTRWVKFVAASGALTARVLAKEEGFDFAAGHYYTADIDRSTHPYELRKCRVEEVVVRLDADHHGLGSQSCGKSPFLCIIDRHRSANVMVQVRRFCRNMHYKAKLSSSKCYWTMRSFVVPNSSMQAINFYRLLSS